MLRFVSAAAALAATGFAWAGQARPDSQILADGLKTWRKPGAIQGHAACATCHSPDGIELAVYDFDDADIVRRATPHLGAPEANLLVDYFHALRRKLNVTKLRDPNLDRPLQPGGAVLPGKTPAERDLAFANELREKLPLLFGPRIETVPQAQAAETELLNLSLTDLQIGFPLNRLSEDVAHGNEHASIAQWLPEDPPLVAQSDLADWYAAEDRYLANPTDAKLHELLLLHIKLVNTSRMPGLGAISAAKFRALLVWQNRIRNHTENDPVHIAPDVELFGNYNLIWEVGEAARTMMDRDAGGLGMDAQIQQKKLAGVPLAVQLHQLRLSWFWCGWLSDQGLFKTSHDDKTNLGMWMSQSLSQDGPYPIHNVFANARRQAVVSDDPAAWGEPLNRKRRIWDFAGLRSFAFHLKDIPADPTARQLYVTFTANCFRMNLLLLEHDIAATGAVWIKISTKSNIAQLIDFIKTQDPSDASNAEALKQRLYAAVDAAKERY